MVFRFRVQLPTTALGSNRFFCLAMSVIQMKKKTPTNFAGVSDVIPPRFERGTYCLEGSCSIQLSYGTFYSLVGMTRLERATPWSQTKYSAN